MTIEDIARATHEVNRVYCQALGDNSQVPWEDAPAWQRESAIAGVSAILRGTVVTSRDAHNSWMEQKKADGWSYGPTKDPEKKLHPCMVPYHDLPASQQVKDHLFRNVVLGLEEQLEQTP